MLSLRWHGNRDLRLDQIEIPKLRPGWVKVKNVWAGICGSGATDVHHREDLTLILRVRPARIHGWTEEYANQASLLDRGECSVCNGSDVRVPVQTTTNISH